MHIRIAKGGNMELIGLGAVLRYGGIYAAAVWITIWAVVGARLGLRLARKSKAGLTEKQDTINCVYFATYLFVGWLFSVGVSLWYDFCLIKWLAIAILAAASCFVISIMLVVKSDSYGPETSFVDRGGNKLWILGGSSGVWIVVLCFMFASPETRLVSLYKPERATWYANQLGTNNEQDNKLAFDKIPIYKQPVPLYFYAVGNFRIGNRKEAARYFKLYSDTLPAESRNYWLAMSSFFADDFASAENYFKNSGDTHGHFLALLSKFRANKLSLQDIADYAKFNNIHADDLEFFQTLRHAIAGMEEVREEIASASPYSLDIDVLNQLKGIRRLLEKEKTGKDGRQGEATFTLTAVELGKQREEMQRKIEESVRYWAYANKPELPGMKQIQATMDKSWVTVLSYPFFMSMLFLAAFIQREFGEYFSNFFSTLTGTLGFPAWISKLGWHSMFARSLAARLARMEPDDEKGLFSKEIKLIHATVFPVDFLLGLRYIFKAQQLLTVKRIDTQERDDLLFVYGTIRKLSGKLVPHGDEQALNIINALRDRADTIFKSYWKGQLAFLPARDELLTTHKELVTLGDILEAFGEKPELTNYHLLGLEPKRNMSDAEIKQAYRSVMGVIHPDHNPNNAFVANLARQVIGAYGILGNPNRRAVYETAIRL